MKNNTTKTEIIPEEKAKQDHIEANKEKKNQAEFDFETVIEEEELEKLLEGILMDTGYEAYAVYGLMFLFSSIRRLVTNDKSFKVEDYCDRSLDLLYASSFNMSDTVKRFEKNLHLAYRKANFRSKNYLDAVQPFLDIDCPEQSTNEETDKPTETALDLSDSSMEDLAQKLSDIMHNPNLPKEIQACLEENLSFNYIDFHTPENILGNLKQLSKSGGEK